MSEFSTMALWEIEFEAMTRDCKVVVADGDVLQFDLDTEDSELQFMKFFWDRLQPRFGTQEYHVNTWKSRNGRTHKTVILPEALQVPDRIALQAQGGSDPGREFAALCCHWDGSPHPILLYKPNPKLLPAESA